MLTIASSCYGIFSSVTDFMDVKCLVFMVYLVNNAPVTDTQFEEARKLAFQRDWCYCSICSENHSIRSRIRFAGALVHTKKKVVR